MLNDYVSAGCFLPAFFFITLTGFLLAVINLYFLLHLPGRREHSEYSEMEQQERSELELSKKAG